VAYREVRVFEVREVLRLWIRGEGLRAIERLAGIDRKTVRRYVAAAVEAGVGQGGGDDQLSDVVLAVVTEAVRPHRHSGHGASWRVLEAQADQIRAWIEEEDLTVAKVGVLLARRGVVVPQRTLERFCAATCGPRRGRPATVRVTDGQPGDELQVDFGRMGMLYDSEADRRRVLHALIFTACCSRHCFVWLTFSQTIEAIIAGFEEAWTFFGGVFRTVIPDNMAGIVDKANPTEPRINAAFADYAASRGFGIDAARVRHPQDKPKVERVVPYVRRSFYAGENFIDLLDAQRGADAWCRTTAGMRIHGTIAARPAEVFRLEELPQLLPAPDAPYDLPIYASPKVHRDHHIEVARALYSIPGNLIGARVEVRADSTLVKVFHRGTLVKTHPRQAPGGRSTDPTDYPAGKSIYALRDLDHLQRLAASHGPAVGAYAAVLLDNPLPWTKMRQVYALLGLVKRWGPEAVSEACGRAAEAEAFNVGLIGRMLERGGGATVPPRQPQQGTLLPGRFAREASEFSTTKGASA
jgi:transposase